MAGSAGNATTGFNMVNQPNGPEANLASLMGGGGGPMPAIDPLGQLASSGVTVPLSPNADPRGVPMPTAGMRGGPSNTLAAPMDPNLRLMSNRGGAPAPQINQPPVMPIGGGKGGGRPAQATPAPTQGQFAPLAPQGGFNVNQASAGALQQAMQGTQAGMGFQAAPSYAYGYTPTMQSVQGQQRAYGYAPAQQQLQGVQTGFGYAPAQQRAFTLSGQNISQYESPYQQAVIDRTMRDLSGAQEKSLNQLGAQATQARAFGGSRQGIAEAETRKGYAEQAADTIANLRERGFQQAMGAAQFDVGQLTGAEAANVGAQIGAQQFGASSAQQAQAANIARQQQIEAANVAARTGAAQYGAGAQTAAEAANIQRAQQVAASNAAQQTAASQYMAQQRQAAQQQNFANQLAAMQARQGAASQLAGLGQQAFGIGQTIQQQQSQQGLLQRGIQQALIDAAQRQYAGFTGAPQAAMQLPLQALGATPTPQTTTSSSNPGLFDYLTTAAMLGVSDIRLKENVQPVENIGGVQFYKWTWNDIGERLKSDGQPSFGVIADDLKETHPHLVKRGKDGYLRVNYHGLKDELEAA